MAQITNDDFITFEGYSYSHERPDLFPHPRMLWKDDSDGKLYYWIEEVKKLHMRGLNDPDFDEEEEEEVEGELEQVEEEEEDLLTIVTRIRGGLVADTDAIALMNGPPRSEPEEGEVQEEETYWGDLLASRLSGISDIIPIPAIRFADDADDVDEMLEGSDYAGGLRFFFESDDETIHTNSFAEFMVASEIELKDLCSEMPMHAVRIYFNGLDEKRCPICLEDMTLDDGDSKMTILGCWHLHCQGCKSKISKCSICRAE